MKFLIDANIPLELMHLLKKEGFNSRHISLSDKPDMDDFGIIEMARYQDEIILTHDLDFGAILSVTGQTKPYVIIFRMHNINARVILNKLLQNINDIKDILETGAIIIIDNDKTRVRKLPIQRIQ
jgi:predicted nuclease of predicted toxin-antitoxin system